MDDWATVNPSACALPQRLHGDVVSPSTISLFRASTIAEIRTQWRRITARLQVLMNADSTAPVLAEEAPTLRRQCERLAAEPGHLADAAGQRRHAPAAPP